MKIPTKYTWNFFENSLKNCLNIGKIWENEIILLELSSFGNNWTKLFRENCVVFK
jgi:hypothetical protein